MALGEAMSMGLPAIGYKSCSAVNELIQDGKNGFLCDDGTTSLAIVLRRLMEDRDKRIIMGSQAHISMKKFTPHLIWDTWEKTLLELVIKSNDDFTKILYCDV